MKSWNVPETQADWSSPSQHYLAQYMGSISSQVEFWWVEDEWDGSGEDESLDEEQEQYRETVFK